MQCTTSGFRLLFKAGRVWLLYDNMLVTGQAKSLHLAQAQYRSLHNGSFATMVSALLNTTICNRNLHTSDTCDLDALRFAAAHPAVFELGITVTQNISSITRACPTRPCYVATVRVTVPLSSEGQDGEAPYKYTASINNNRDTTVQHNSPTAVAPCL